MEPRITFAIQLPSYKEDVVKASARYHAHKFCDHGKHDALPEGGVSLKTKWICKKCWPKYLKNK